MSKTTFQFRLICGPDKILCWPRDVPLPELDENLQSCAVLHEIHEIVRSIDGLAVVEDGDDLVVYGQRTMTVNHLPNETRVFRGRVSLDNKPRRGTRTRIRVRLPDDRLATLEVLKCV